MKTVVGLYEDINDAQAAINDLVRSGFDRGDVSLVASNRWTDEEIGTAGVEGDQMASDVAAGVATGGVIGGLGGVLLGLGALAIPGIGPIIAAGPLVAGLAGAGIGAAVGGLVGALVNWGVPEEEVDLYAESVRRGGVLVGLKTDESRVEKAVGIMNRYSPMDIERRSEYWRETGWTGYDETQPAWTTDEIATDRANYSEYLDYSSYTPAYQEHYQSTYGNSGRDYVSYDPAYRYGYRLANDERYADYQTWNELEADARRGWEQTEYAAGQTWDDFKDAVRRGWEEVKDAIGYGSSYDMFEPGYREHYDSTYADRGRDYDWYTPGYRYGYDLGMDDRYSDYETWDDLEVEARREWDQSESALGRTWDDIKDAVRRGWEDVMDALDIETDYAEMETVYRDHYNTQYRTGSHTYDWYEPAYRYGFISGMDDRYQNYAMWGPDLETEIRRDWETGHYADRSTWDEIKDAVRSGWESVRETFDTDDPDRRATYGGVRSYPSNR
ncbi:MAG: hypothetical protein R6X18_20205 [Chloroflexota bacterium]|jgi:hypothetical protein